MDILRWALDTWAMHNLLANQMKPQLVSATLRLIGINLVVTARADSKVKVVDNDLVGEIEQHFFKIILVVGPLLYFSVLRDPFVEFRRKHFR